MAIHIEGVIVEAIHIIGLSGGSEPTRAPVLPTNERIQLGSAQFCHDSAAVLVSGGDVIAALEQERLNRVKHTNKVAGDAVRACLHIAGLTADQVDRFVYYAKETNCNDIIALHILQHPRITPVFPARAYLADVLSEELEACIDPARVMFVEHHLAHATSAYAMSGFDEALVMTLDGIGDGLSGTVWVGEGGRLTRLLDLSRQDSLGMLYYNTIGFLGYEAFDEYKVMGLAPYGRAEGFRGFFERVCVLGPDGQVEVRMENLRDLFDVLPHPRRSGEPLTDTHRDLAAALQETLERAAFHLLDHHQRNTRLDHLCLAGGVAHNSSMVGKIARSGLFARVFAQPASHDAGCALGAALSAHQQLAPSVRIKPLRHVYWGPDLGESSSIERQLRAWSDVVDLQPNENVASTAATLIANGAVIGWLQGRSEFGPRALGNRSILADPRPASNKDRINDLVKRREAYRPFAPSVLEELADEWFEMPLGSHGAFMTFTVPVREHARDVLGAVTHVDGTARVQTVSRESNPRFWNLIEAFRRETGVPVLLNTSFNHSVEPIVDSIDDAVTCFLTTGLTHLVVGDWVVTRRALTSQRVLKLVPVLPAHVRLTHARTTDRNGRLQDVYCCENTAERSRTHAISRTAHALLLMSDHRTTVGDLLDDHGELDATVIATELEDLWARRLVRLLPPAVCCPAEWTAAAAACANPIGQ